MLEGSAILPVSGQKPKKLVVLFHGYGSHGEDLLGLARQWTTFLPETEFLAPDGPEPCETYASAFQWFSLNGFTPASMRKGLDKAGPVVRKYLEAVLKERSLAFADLALAGFSQGGMLALEMMLVAPEVRGVICYSGGFYPPLALPSAKLGTKALLVHGDRDEAVPYAAFQAARHSLEKIGVIPQTLTCPGLGHSINREGIETGGKFLKSLFYPG